MSHNEVVAEILGLAMRGSAGAAISRADSAASAMDPPDPVALAAARAMAHFSGADFEAAARTAMLALAASEERGTAPLSRLLAVAARLVSSAASLWAGADAIGDEALAAELAETAPIVLSTAPERIRWHAASLVFEAFFTNGRFHETERMLDGLLPGLDWRTQPPAAAASASGLSSLPFVPVRVLFYLGRIADAEALLLAARELDVVRADPMWSRLSEALIAVCAGAKGETARVRKATARVAESFPRPRGYLDAAARVFAGYGLLSVGDAEAAVREIRAGGGPRLKRLIVVDRALAIEVLMRDALARSDAGAVARLGRELLALEAHPVVSDIALRVYATVDLHNAAPGSALEKSEAAIARAHAAGVLRHVAESELIRSRALIETGNRDIAARELQRLAHSARERGDIAEHRMAARTLRTIGKRVTLPRGSGLAGLSEREAEVARLAARGLDDRTIGEALFLSPRTVGGILARVMQAFDVERRSALAVAIRPATDEDEGAPSNGGSSRGSAITKRQREIIELIAHGRTNREIAAELGISPRTVERHVSMALEAYGARSRTELAYRVLAGR